MIGPGSITLLWAVIMGLAVFWFLGGTKHPGHHENLSDLDAGDWVLSFRLTIPALAGPGIVVTDGFQLKPQLHPGEQMSCR